MCMSLVWPNHSHHAHPPLIRANLQFLSRCSLMWQVINANLQFLSQRLLRLQSIGANLQLSVLKFSELAKVAARPADVGFALILTS